MSNLQIDLKPKVMKTTLRILRVDVGSAHYVQGKGQRKLAKMQNERGQLLFYSSDSSPLFTLKFYLCVSEWSGGIKSSGCPPIRWLSHEGAIRAEQATQDNELGWRGVCQSQVHRRLDREREVARYVPQAPASRVRKSRDNTIQSISW